MAETLVLANLTVDSSGVAGGINSANASLQQGQLILGRFGAAQTQVASTTSQVVGRLFNFRAALLAVARSLGIVGIITGLALALKGLVSDLVSNTTWFKRLRESVTDWYNEVFKGEKQLDQFIRKMKEASEGGITSWAATLEKVKGLEEQRLNILAKMRNLDLDRNDNFIQAKILEADLHKVNAELIIMADQLESIGISRARLRFEAIPTNPGVGISASGLPAAAGAVRGAIAGASSFEEGGDQNVRTILDEMGLGVGVVEHRLALANEALNLFGANMAAFGGQARQEIRESLIDQFTAAGQSIDQINEKFRNFGIEAISITEQVGETLAETSLKAELMATAANAIGAAFVRAFEGDNTSMKQFFAEMLNSMVPVLAGYGAMLLVRGLVTFNPADIAASGIAFAAAGAAALAARALGGSGSESGSEAASGFGGGDVGAIGASGGGGTSVSVIVHGSLIGSSEDDLARSLERLLRTARGDGG